jgi:hypothetical protein
MINGTFTLELWCSPLFLLPLADFSFTSLPFPFTYLETLLGVIGSRPPWSQVTRKLTSPFSTPPHSKFPVPQVNCAPYYDDIMILASHGPEHLCCCLFKILVTAIALFRLAWFLKHFLWVGSIYTHCIAIWFLTLSAMIGHPYPWSLPWQLRWAKEEEGWRARA